MPIKSQRAQQDCATEKGQKFVSCVCVCVEREGTATRLFYICTEDYRYRHETREVVCEGFSGRGAFTCLCTERFLGHAAPTCLSDTIQSSTSIGLIIGFLIKSVFKWAFRNELIFERGAGTDAELLRSQLDGRELNQCVESIQI